MTNYDYDVIIAGGGMSGLITASSIAVHSKQKARVLVVDRNPPTEPGKKTINGWTCGDAVSKKSVDYIFENLGIRYGTPELEHQVEGVLLYSPDHETKVLFDGVGFILNRKLMPKRQVEDATKLGVEFAFNVAIDEVYAEDGYVRGVIGRDTKNNTSFKKTARMIIDSAGSATTLRRSLPIKSNIDIEIDRDDLESTGRYIFEFESGAEDPTWFDSRYAIIHFDQYLAPGGYCWTFAKGKNKVNIGLGVQKSALDKRNTKYGKKDTLQSLIDEYVKQNKSLKNPIQSPDENDAGNTKGSWQVSVRRHNDCLVANGYAIVGDAAWMARPVDAGGMGPAIYAGVILGKIVAQAIEANDTSEQALWQYNVDYMNFYGFQMASFEILRRYLQTLTNEQISYGMKYFLSEEDIGAIVKREHPKFGKLKLLNPAMLARVAAHPDLARGLQYTAKKSETLIAHNLKYPTSPAGFGEWKKKLVSEMEEAYKRF
ncbi:MAG: NAD(P)/FAD-dependent oxidoreductase [Nitrososphaerales archaeon]|jgi:flavin-dependent dehydrogenase